MQVNLHKNARTTPAMRRELRASPLPMAELARRYHLSQATVRKWRRREEGADRSHRPPTCTPPSPPPRRRWSWPGASPGCCPGMTSWR